MNKYRERIYRDYLNHETNSSPLTIRSFGSRWPYFHRVMRHLPADKGISIVDLGCGHGAFMHALKCAGYSNVVGVDHSAVQVAEAKRLGIPNACHADLREYLREKHSQSIDAVVSFDVIEHFNKDELVEFVDDVWRVLKHGGVWVIHTTNAESPFGARALYNDFSHEISFTKLSITQLLTSSGFSKVACFEDAPVIHGIVSLVRNILWRIIRLGLSLYLVAETGAYPQAAVLTQNFLIRAQKP